MFKFQTQQHCLKAFARSRALHCIHVVQKNCNKFTYWLRAYLYIHMYGNILLNIIMFPALRYITAVGGPGGESSSIKQNSSGKIQFSNLFILFQGSECSLINVLPKFFIRFSLIHLFLIRRMHLILHKF